MPTNTSLSHQLNETQLYCVKCSITQRILKVSIDGSWYIYIDNNFFIFIYTTYIVYNKDSIYHIE